eukprot:scaffold1050_cov176-Ochromonas_danica.AAC.16
MVELKAIDQWAFNYTGAVHGTGQVGGGRERIAHARTHEDHGTTGLGPSAELVPDLFRPLPLPDLFRHHCLFHQSLQPWDHLPLLPSFHHVGDQPRLHGLCLLLELHELKAEGSGSMEMHELKAEGLATAGTVNRGPDRGSGPAHLPRIYPSSFFDSFPLRGEI